MRGHDIKKIVGQYYGLNIDSKSRNRILCQPRQIAQYLCVKKAELTYGQIALLFQKDSTTIVSNVRKIVDLKKDCPEVAREIADIEAVIENKLRDIKNNA